jgi:hypothetical protein
MSTSIRLIGIKNLRIDASVPTPGITFEQGWLGFSNLKHSIRIYADKNPDVLLFTLDIIEGVRQYLVADPDTFLTDVRENPHYWNSVGLGWQAAMDALQKDLEEGHLLIWWLIIDY